MELLLRVAQVIVPECVAAMVLLGNARPVVFVALGLALALMGQ